MKHGIKLRKLQRTSSHRQALLRNLVTALLHHETIKTTVPKAKEAARMAEKLITFGKKGTNPSFSKAQAYLVPPHYYGEARVPQPVAPFPAPGVEAGAEPKSLLRKVFTTLATRYAERPGGYTRIQKFGRRPGDHAPVAIVSLVDGPRDLKFEMTARAVAREATVEGRERGSSDRVPDGFKGTRDLTRKNVDKVLKYRGDEGKQEFEKLAQEFSALLIAEQKVEGHRRPAPPSEHAFQPYGTVVPHLGRRVKAGERLPGMSVAHTGLGLARGELGSTRNRKRGAEDASPRFALERRRRDEDEFEIRHA